MSKNQISIEIPQNVITEVEQKLKECQKLLAPYLQALTAEEVKSLFKMGDKTLATVQKVNNYLQTNPEFAPAYMDKAEFQKDVKVVEQLTPILNITKQLTSDLQDTVILSGSEALTNGMLYYGMTKEAAYRGVATAKPIYEDLSPRFQRGGKKKQ